MGDTTTSGLPPAPAQAVEGLERLPDPAGAHGLIRLNRNERTEPLPDWFVVRIRAAISNQVLTAYPAVDELYEELSTSLHVETQRLLITAGSDAAVKALYQSFVRRGDAVVALDPSYAMYRVYARMFEAALTEIPIGGDLAPDPDRLLGSIAPGVRLVVLANPNQPTGTLLDEGLLAEVLARAAQVGALVAIDEAYFPFSDFTMLSRIHEFPNLLIIRTFSKAAGLAGLRIGYAVGHPRVVSSLWKVRSAHDVNSIAILCAREVLRFPDVVDEFVAQVEQGKRLLAAEVLKLGLTPIPTPTNFMLVRVAPRYEPRALVDALAEEGYLVRGPFVSSCISDCIRVTLGAPPLMTAFSLALKQALERTA